MALTIELPSNIEQQLLKGAMQKGISLENYLVQLLSSATRTQTKQVKDKPLSEPELLEKINALVMLTDAEWTTYRRLLALRKAELLTESEYEQLIELGEKMEQANVIRIKYLIALAKLKGVTLDKVMADLGIFPVEL